jgi:RNA polymerase sigma-70 factor (ECF subfamily)
MTFFQLYERYKDLVFNLALNYVCNVPDAEEITQDVFVKVYNELPKFRHEANPKTWIYRITVNQSLDFIKAKNRNKRSFLKNILRFNDAENSFEVTNFNHPGVQLENKEDLKRLFDKINSLPENQKTVLILLKIECLTQKEVSEILSMQEGAVESLFQRAKKNLKNRL